MRRNQQRNWFGAAFEVEETEKDVFPWKAGRGDICPCAAPVV